MGYSVSTSGRLLLPARDEQRAHDLLRARMLAVQDSGWLHDGEPTGSLEELASFAAAQLSRHGDALVVAPDVDGDPKWSEQATAFWLGLGELVTDGRVEVEGDDGCTWSYEFTPHGVVQRGTNGWDGSGDGTGWPDEDEEPPRQEPEQSATRRARSRRYLVFGAIPFAGGAGLLATGNGGWFPLAVGTFNLLVGWRLSRPR